MTTAVNMRVVNMIYGSGNSHSEGTDRIEQKIRGARTVVGPEARGSRNALEQGCRRESPPGVASRTWLAGGATWGKSE